MRWICGRCLRRLHQLAADNAQGEYYLTDLIGLYRQKKLRVEALPIESADELRGVNSRVELAELGAVLRARKNREVMFAGVTLEDPATTYIDAQVTIGADTIIGPGVVLQGSTTIGESCQIQSGCRLTNATIGARVTILDHSVITDSRVHAGAKIGPLAHIRPESEIGENAHVGNFVELKKTTLGKGSKANHLAYLGDATIGERANIGAGTNHLQLRRREKAPDDHRRRGVHRVGFAAHRARSYRRRRVCGRRILDYEGRAARCTGRRARASTEPSGMGRGTARETIERIIPASCAASSGMWDRSRCFRSSWKDCASSSTAATIRPASRSVKNGEMLIRRSAGKLSKLDDVLAKDPVDGRVRHRPYALGHARQAHGRERASASRLHGRIVVVHNGIIENYLELKRELTAQGTRSSPKRTRRSSRIWWSRRAAATDSWRRCGARCRSCAACSRWC
jgi:carbonic anhydrase/acetyltransferase-like protein (isoleucine patch superfamily)